MCMARDLALRVPSGLGVPPGGIGAAREWPQAPATPPRNGHVYIPPQKLLSGVARRTSSGPLLMCFGPRLLCPLAIGVSHEAGRMG